MEQPLTTQQPHNNQRLKTHAYIKRASESHATDLHATESQATEPHATDSHTTESLALRKGVASSNTLVYYIT